MMTPKYPQIQVPFLDVVLVLSSVPMDPYSIHSRAPPCSDISTIDLKMPPDIRSKLCGVSNSRMYPSSRTITRSESKIVSTCPQVPYTMVCRHKRPETGRCDEVGEVGCALETPVNSATKQSKAKQSKPRWTLRDSPDVL